MDITIQDNQLHQGHTHHPIETTTVIMTEIEPIGDPSNVLSYSGLMVRYRDAPVGPRDYRDQPRSSSYHPTYSATPSPPTGPRGYSAYQPSRQPERPRSPRPSDRTPSGPAGWSRTSGDRRYIEPSRRDYSPASSAPSRPRT